MMSFVVHPVSSPTSYHLELAEAHKSGILSDSPADTWRDTMYKAIPPIHETAEELKRLQKQEHHRLKQQRLHALYLLASGQAHERQEVAALLGVSRNTVGHWLDIYADGGLKAL